MESSVIKVWSWLPNRTTGSQLHFARKINVLLLLWWLLWNLGWVVDQFRAGLRSFASCQCPWRKLTFWKWHMIGPKVAMGIFCRLIHFLQELQHLVGLRWIGHFVDLLFCYFGGDIRMQSKVFKVESWLLNNTPESQLHFARTKVSLRSLMKVSFLLRWDVHSVMCWLA